MTVPGQGQATGAVPAGHDAPNPMTGDGGGGVGALIRRDFCFAQSEVTP
jgi:hypothetical protein